MEIAAIVVSVLAFALSAFTFYWLNIREINNLYLLRIDRMAAFLVPEFALVNGGSKDILITTIECGFQNKKHNGRDYPNQHITFNESRSLLLQAGKAIHCKVIFPEPFTSSFALEGERMKNTKPATYKRRFYVDIAWINSKGENSKVSVAISEYGFCENGDMCMRSPLQRRHNLHEKPDKSLN